MANIKDCPGFETFGADVKEARKVKQLSRKTLAEQVNIDWRPYCQFNYSRSWFFSRSSFGKTDKSWSTFRLMVSSSFARTLIF